MLKMANAQAENFAPSLKNIPWTSKHSKIRMDTE